LFHPVKETTPVRRPEQNDREVLDLAGLSKRQRLEELVESAEAAGEDHEASRVLHEHVLAYEEVAELDAEVDVLVQRLLVRQLDVAAHGQPAHLVASAVDGLHDPGPATGDDGEAAIGQRR